GAASVPVRPGEGARPGVREGPYAATATAVAAGAGILRPIAYPLSDRAPTPDCQISPDFLTSASRPDRTDRPPRLPEARGKPPHFPGAGPTDNARRPMPRMVAKRENRPHNRPKHASCQPRLPGAGGRIR